MSEAHSLHSLHSTGEAVATKLGEQPPTLPQSDTQFDTQSHGSTRSGVTKGHAVGEAPSILPQSDAQFDTRSHGSTRSGLTKGHAVGEPPPIPQQSDAQFDTRSHGSMRSGAAKGQVVGETLPLLSQYDTQSDTRSQGTTRSGVTKGHAVGEPLPLLPQSDAQSDTRSYGTARSSFTKGQVVGEPLQPRPRSDTQSDTRSYGTARSGFTKGPAVGEPLPPLPQSDTQSDTRSHGTTRSAEGGHTKDLCASFEPVTLQALLHRLADACTDEVDSDSFGQGLALQRFEAEVAHLLGKPAALFFANDAIPTIVAFRAHAAQRIVMHPASRFLHRQGLTDASVQRLGVPTLAQELLPSDIAAPTFVGDFSGDLGVSDILNLAWRTRECLYMELPCSLLGGATMKWDDVESISKCLRKGGAKCHLDGARLLEIQPFYQKTLPEIAANFDSLTVSFRESCGALGGTVLAGSVHFINEAKQWRGRLGGVSDTFAPQWIHCQQSLQNVLPSFPQRLEELRSIVAVLSSDPFFKGLLRFNPAIPQACFVHVYVRAEENVLQVAHENVFARTGLHLWDRLRGPGCSRKGEVFFEWGIGPHNLGIPHEQVLSGWRALVEELCLLIQR